ncbi:MAG: c-type cytochrome [Planctomycetota bacterium]
MIAKLILWAWTATGPAPQEPTEPLRPGLVATFEDEQTRVVTVVPDPNFALGEGESVHPRIGPRFRARWEGMLRVHPGGVYVLSLSTAGRLWIDGREVHERPVTLEPGEHALALFYERREPQASLQLVWRSETFGPEPVPAGVLGHRSVPREAEETERIERGREAVTELRCAGCHGGPAVQGLRREAPDLTGVGSRLRSPWLVRWLEHPRQVRPHASMPAVLEAGEGADVAAYLAGLRDPGLRPGPLPTHADRVSRGKELYAALGCAACHGRPEETLGDVGVKWNPGALAAYLADPLRFHPQGRMPSMLLSQEEASLLSEFLMDCLSRGPETEARAGDPERGRKLVAIRGCLGCHRLNGEGPREPGLRASALDSNATESGCLEDSPRPKGARYDLSRGRRKDILAFLRSGGAAGFVSPAPGYGLGRTLERLRCTACHAWEGGSPVGVIEPPPPLTGVGFKLREAWLGDVLLNRKRVRPWMRLRMPQFSRQELEGLPRALRGAAGLLPEPPRASRPSLAPEQVQYGIRLLGKGQGGLSCIACHDFQGRASLGTRGPDMVQMYERLRPEWFRRWMRDPGRLQPGTAMPQYFAGVAEPQVQKVIDALWDVLSLGDRMPLPEGFPDPKETPAQSVLFQVAVRDEPMVIRAVLPGASASSIAVGFPAGVSICFDAELCRFRYAWTGGFLDMRGVWEERGMSQMARPLGRICYTAPDLFPLRFGDPNREPRRVRFRGYLLAGDRVPVFLYEVDGASVRERIEPAGGAGGLRRTFWVEGPAGPVWFLAGPADAGTIKVSAGVWVDRQWLKLSVPQDSPWTVTIEGKGEE